MRAGRRWVTGVHWRVARPVPELDEYLRAVEAEDQALDELRRYDDPRVTAAQHERFAARARAAGEPVQLALDAILAAGLEWRCPPLSTRPRERRRTLAALRKAGLDEPPLDLYGPSLRGDDLSAFESLLRLGARLPGRVSVCEDCRVVFRRFDEDWNPSRKRHAAKCRRCAHSPRPSKPDDGAVVETFDPRTLDPRGWSRQYVRRCADCGERFYADRRDAAYCPGGTCAKRAARARLG